MKGSLKGHHRKKRNFLDTLCIEFDVEGDIDVDDQIETCSVIVGGAGLVNNQGDCNVTAGSSSGAQTVKPCPKLDSKSFLNNLIIQQFNLII